VKKLSFVDKAKLWAQITIEFSENIESHDMNIFRRVISPSLSPNCEADDVWGAVKTLFSPWKWKDGKELADVKDWFRKRFGEAILFNSGRSALHAILKAFDIGVGDEVIVQAFTCVAVPNSVRWAGAKPVFADIDEMYNIDPESFENRITKKTKAVIVQHTFGRSANMKAILPIAKKHNLLVIEDFAHSMSLPMQGDAAFFSFGRDKVLSSVWGGAAIISTKHEARSTKLKQYQEKLPMPNAFWIFQQLLHPMMFTVILPTYNMGIGKLLLVLLQKLRLLSFPVYPEEKTGKQPSDFPARYPNALAALLLRQLHKLDRFTRQRREISKHYGEEDAYLRFPMQVSDPEAVRDRAKARGILLGNWYHNIVDPNGVDFAAIGYQPGSCPKAEEASQHIINLPTRVTSKQAFDILQLVRIYDT